MGRMSRQKGKRGEREAAAELGKVFGCPSRRGVQFQGGPESPDVVLEGVALHVEAKRTERLALWSAIEQAEADAPAGSVPVVWHKANRRESIVIVRTRDLGRFVDECARKRLENKGETHATSENTAKTRFCKMLHPAVGGKNC